MSSQDKLTAEFEPASNVCTLLMPGWPNQPEIVAREDGRDAITVVASRCHPNEVWRLVLLRKGKLSVIAYLNGRADERPVRTIHDAVVMVPPDKVATFQVVTESFRKRGSA